MVLISISLYIKASYSLASAIWLAFCCHQFVYENPEVYDSRNDCGYTDAVDPVCGFNFVGETRSLITRLRTRSSRRFCISCCSLSSSFVQSDSCSNQRHVYGLIRVTCIYSRLHKNTRNEKRLIRCEHDDVDLGPVARTLDSANRQLHDKMLRLRRPAVAQAGGASLRLTDG